MMLHAEQDANLGGRVDSIYGRSHAVGPSPFVIQGPGATWQDANNDHMHVGRVPPHVSHHVPHPAHAHALSASGWNVERFQMHANLW